VRTAALTTRAPEASSSDFLGRLADKPCKRNKRERRERRERENHDEIDSQELTSDGEDQQGEDGKFPSAKQKRQGSVAWIRLRKTVHEVTAKICCRNPPSDLTSGIGTLAVTMVPRSLDAICK
jgi:hypothetical protein